MKGKPGLLLQPYVLAQLTGAVVDRAVSGSNVSASEYAVTSWLNARGSATPSELAHELGLAPTTLSSMLDRLVRKKQIRRVRHPDDGRSALLELTPQGKATIGQNNGRLVAMLKALKTNLDGDPEEILDTLRRLEDALRRTLRTT
ncbi:MAG TPA: MarR family winged helix-turn-helix transcriptional regulator [Gaiellaceae bacterium]